MSLFALEIYRGDTVKLKLTVTLDDAAFDLTGSTVYFTIKSDPSESDSDALASYTSAAGITLLDSEGGEAVVTMPATDTADWPLDRKLFAEAKVKNTADEILTVAAGTIKVLPSILQSPA